MIYYIINEKTKRCYGLANTLPAPIDGAIVFGSETILDNPRDYVLKDNEMVYDPIQKEGEAT